MNVDSIQFLQIKRGKKITKEKNKQRHEQPIHRHEAWIVQTLWRHSTRQLQWVVIRLIQIKTQTKRYYFTNDQNYSPTVPGGVRMWRNPPSHTWRVEVYVCFGDQWAVAGKVKLCLPQALAIPPLSTFLNMRSTVTCLALFVKE